MEKNKKSPQIKTQNQQKTLPKESFLDKVDPKYYLLIIPILAVIYYSYRYIALGFYQDDEIAQYINMIQFWHDPWAILGNGPKPGYKIFMVLPALFGYDYVLMLNSLIAAVTVYMTYFLLRTYKIPYAIFGAFLLAAQPMFLELSFRSYSEIFTSLLIIIFLILYKKEKFFFSALLCGYIFTVRQEIALLLLVMAIIFFRKKQYLCILGLAIFPILYDLLGFIKTGDIMFVVTEMRSVAALNYKTQGLGHYFKVYIFIVGPVCLSLFLLGFFGFFKDTKKWKEYVNEYLLFYVIFISIFVVQMLTMLNDGPNPGNWRYLLHISPVCAFFAVVGFNNLSDLKFRSLFYIITGTLAVLVLLFLSYTTDGFKLLDKPDYSKVIFIAVFIASTIFLWDNSKVKYLNKLSVFLMIISVVYLFVSIEPRKLSPENISVRETAEFVDTLPDINNKEKLANHTFVLFYSKSYKNNPDEYKKLDLKNLQEAPKGSIIIWESHYGYRPEFKNDVQLDVLQKNPAGYKFLKQIVSQDQRFASFVFEKL